MLGPASPPSIFARSACKLAICLLPRALSEFMAACQTATQALLEL
jgi:hypothetical protein